MGTRVILDVLQEQVARLEADVSTSLEVSTNLMT